MPDWEFRDPWFLFVGVAVACLLWRLRRPSSFIQYSSLSLLQRVRRGWRARWAWLPTFLNVLAVIALAIALARPRTPNAETRVTREGIAIMMAVDRSSSMMARDLVRDDRSVDRLSVVKDVFARFVLGDNASNRAGRPDDMIGLVSFSGYADSICPLTSDHGNLVHLAKQLKIETRRNEDGTAIGDAIGLAVERLRQSDIQSKVVILLTDGVQTAGAIDPLRAAELAQQSGIKIYAVGAGTQGFAPIPIRDSFTGRTVLRRMPVEIDEKTLREIAKKTGGKYYRASDAEALDNVYRQIDALERTEVSELRYLQYTEHYRRFLLLGMSFVGVAVIMSYTLFRRLP